MYILFHSQSTSRKGHSPRKNLRGHYVGVIIKIWKSGEKRERDTTKISRKKKKRDIKKK